MHVRGAYARKQSYSKQFPRLGTGYDEGQEGLLQLLLYLNGLRD